MTTRVKIRITCEGCGTLLIERDLTANADVSFVPCQKCTADLAEQLRDLRRERGQALVSARVARDQVIQHRRVIDDLLAVTGRLIELQVPPPSPTDVPF